MSGIAGYFAPSGLAPEEGSRLLSRLLDALDDGARGSVVGRTCGLGARAPAETGPLPYRSARGDVALALWPPSSDPAATEALAERFEDDETEALGSIRGGFAVAVWVERQGRLWLGRDRFGARPLYLAWVRGGRMLLFASDVRALLRSGLVEPRLDGRATLDVLSMGHPLPPRTLWAGIERLPAGAALSVEVRGRVALTSASFAPRSGAGPGSEDLAIPSSPAVLLDGADGALLAAIGARVGPLRTYTAGAGRGFDDDLRFGERVADRLGTEHTSVGQRPVDRDRFEAALGSTGAPSLDLGPVHEAQLYGAVRAAGESSLALALRPFANDARPPGWAARVGSDLAAFWRGQGELGARRLARRLGPAFVRGWGAAPRELVRWATVAHFADRMLARRWPIPPGRARLPGALAAPPLLLPGARRASALDLASGAFEARLSRAVRLADAVGLELRFPLLDPGFERDELRRLEATMPGFVRRRRPRPFPCLDPMWPFGPGGPPGWVREALGPASLARLGLFDGAAVGARIEHIARPGARAHPAEIAVLRAALGIELLTRKLGVDAVAWPEAGD